MPDQRLSRVRGHCLCPDGVCLYRSGDAPGFCRQRQRTPARCTVASPTPGIVCDRELGHDGPHRGYREDQDAVVFWVGPAFTPEHPDRCPTCGAYPYPPRRTQRDIPPGDY